MGATSVALAIDWVQAGKAIPVDRGAGVLNQPGVELAIQKVRDGEWLHVFPEGKVCADRDPSVMLPFKWGVGRTVCEAAKGPEFPVVLPFFHRYAWRSTCVGTEIAIVLKLGRSYGEADVECAYNLFFLARWFRILSAP